MGERDIRPRDMEPTIGGEPALVLRFRSLREMARNNNVLFSDRESLEHAVEDKLQKNEIPFTLWYITRNLHSQKVAFIDGSEAERDTFVTALARHDLEHDIDWKKSGVILLDHSSSHIDPSEPHQP